MMSLVEIGPTYPVHLRRLCKDALALGGLPSAHSHRMLSAVPTASLLPVRPGTDENQHRTQRHPTLQRLNGVPNAIPGRIQQFTNIAIGVQGFGDRGLVAPLRPTLSCRHGTAGERSRQRPVRPPAGLGGDWPRTPEQVGAPQAGPRTAAPLTKTLATCRRYPLPRRQWVFEVGRGAIAGNRAVRVEDLSGPGMAVDGEDRPDTGFEEGRRRVLAPPTKRRGSVRPLGPLGNRARPAHTRHINVTDEQESPRYGDPHYCPTTFACSP
jgi:hypothetical protein